MRAFSIVALIVGLVLLLGCGGSGAAPGELATVMVAANPTSLYPGQSSTVTATVSDTSNQGVTWSFSPAGFGTLSSKTANPVTYTPPTNVSTATKVTITATSTASATASASVQIAVSALAFDTLVNFGIDNGADVKTSLAQGTDGNIYGTSDQGGLNFAGLIFSVSPSGTQTTFYSFCAQTNCADGGAPEAGLVLSTDGDFYGTTSGGGANGHGTVFKITSGGTLTTLYSFCPQPHCPDGTNPSGLVQATEGNFYGSTYYGGGYTPDCSPNGCGTVFKITPEGTLTTLYSFCLQAGCPDGRNPSGLIQAADGNFYGATYTGGIPSANGGGTVFKITPAGTLTTIYSFCSQANCADGRYSYAGLIQAADGNVYGTTSGGGANGYGTVFKLTSGGTLTTLHSFRAQQGQGQSPASALIQATDGNFYGTTSGGGDLTCIAPYGCGTVFQITSGGTLTTLHSFELIDGAGPWGALLQATTGNFYGTTSYGIDTPPEFSYGTLFSLSVGLGPFVSLVSNSGTVGQTDGILGQGFTGTTGVSFNGTSASFTVVSDTYLTATVPNGATTGYVTVTTPSGTLTSNKEFQISP